MSFDADWLRRDLKGVDKAESDARDALHAQRIAKESAARVSRMYGRELEQASARLAADVADRIFRIVRGRQAAQLDQVVQAILSQHAESVGRSLRNSLSIYHQVQAERVIEVLNNVRLVQVQQIEQLLAPYRAAAMDMTRAQLTRMQATIEENVADLKQRTPDDPSASATSEAEPESPSPSNTDVNIDFWEILNRVVVLLTLYEWAGGDPEYVSTVIKQVVQLILRHL